jgi:hypothetical protein
MNKNTYIVIFFIIVLIALYVFRDDLKKLLNKQDAKKLPTGAGAGSGNTGTGTGSTGGGTTTGTGTGAGTGTGGGTSTSTGTGTGASGNLSTMPKTLNEILDDFYNAFEVTEKEQDANKSIKEIDALNDKQLAEIAIAFYDKYRKNMLSITGITSFFGCGYSSETCNLLRKTRDRLKVLQGSSTYNPKSYVDAFIL